MAGRFDRGRFNAGRFVRSGSIVGPTYTVSISGLTANPDFGQTAQIGVQLTAVAENWSEAPPASVSWQWRDGAGDIAGATSATYTPVAGDDLSNIYAVATPSDTYAARSSAAYIVRYAPPVAGSIADQSFETGSGDQTVNASVAFTGSDLGYSISSSIAGVTVTPVSGVITIPTGADATGSITVTATNSGGSAGDTFNVTIAPLAAGDIVFGAHTLVGAGAAPISEADGTYGEFTVASGQITGNTSPLTVGDVTIGGTTVSVVASTYSVLPDRTEIGAALAAAVGGNTVTVRDGTETGARIDATGLDFSGGAAVTIRGETATQPDAGNLYQKSRFAGHGTLLPGIDLTGSQNIILRDLRLTREKELADGINDAFVVTCTGAAEIEVTNCEVYSTPQSARTPWLNEPIGQLFGVGGTCDHSIVIHKNYLHDLQSGAKVRVDYKTWIEDNLIEDCYGNFGEQHQTSDHPAVFDAKWNRNRCQGVWARGGGNSLGQTGPNKPFAAAQWKIPVADSSSFAVGENITGGTSGETAEIVGIEPGWLYIDGPNYINSTIGHPFDPAETITGDVAGSSTSVGEELGVFPYDYGDPHSSLHGTSWAHNGFQMDANIMLVAAGRREAAYVGTPGHYRARGSGPKWNDQKDNLAYHFQNVTITNNILEPTDNIGIQLGHMDNLEFAFNTILVDEANAPELGLPGVNMVAIGPNSSIHHNVAPSYATTTGDPGLGLAEGLYRLSHENVCAVPNGLAAAGGAAIEYAAMFEGPTFTDVDLDNIIAMTQIKAGGRLDKAVKIGATAYYDHATGVQSSVPAWSKPRTTTTTGIRGDQVVFELADAARFTPFPASIGPTDEFTLVVGLQATELADTASQYLMLGVDGNWGLRRLGSPYERQYMQFFLEGAGGASALTVESSLPFRQEDGFTIWTITGKLSTGEIQVMKDDLIDPFAKVSFCAGIPAVGGSAYSTFAWGGNVEFVLIDNTRLDLYDQATLNKVVSLDGNHPAYGPDGSTLLGSAAVINLAGDALAWNNVAGLNLGSAPEKLIMHTGSVTDYVPDTTPPVLTSPSGAAVDQISASLGVTTDEGNGKLYVVVSTNGTTPSVVQMQAGQDAAGAPGIHAVIGQPVTASGAQTLANATGLTEATTYYAHYFHRDFEGNASAVVTSASFATPASTYSPVWAQWPATADAVLSRGGELTNAASVVTDWLIAYTFTPSAADAGADKHMLYSTASTNRAFEVYKYAAGFNNKFENNANAPIYHVYTSGGLTAGVPYLLLFSYIAGVGPVSKCIRVDTGANIPFSINVNGGAGQTMDWSVLGDVLIGALNTSHANNITSQMERLMVWQNVSADITDPAEYGNFYSGGGLADPADAVTAYGGGAANLLIDMRGPDFVNGNNRGSGGAFTKQGAGVITTV